LILLSDGNARPLGLWPIFEQIRLEAKKSAQKRTGDAHPNVKMDQLVS
jgi:hypothetical protein